MQTNQLKHSNAPLQKHPPQKREAGPKHVGVNKTIPNHSANGNHQPAPNNTIPRRYCRLIKVENFKFDKLEEGDKIYPFEEAFIEFSKHSQNEAFVEGLILKDANFRKLVSKASIFAFLADSPDKHLKYLCAASANDQWQDTLTSMNIIIFDGFCFLKHSVRVRLAYLIEFLIGENPKNLDNVICNFFRECNAGGYIGSTAEVVELLIAACEVIIRKKDWFSKYPSNGNATLFPCIFLTLSRFLSELPANYERCRSLLIHVVDWILRERFKDLIVLGRDLILSLQRVSKLFPAYWKNLVHQPQSLIAGFEGIPQLLSTKCSPAVVANRIAFRLQYCLDRILIYRPEIIYSHHCEWLTADFLDGFDSCSFRSELIRFIINNPRYQTANDPIKQCRNALLVHLITNSMKKGFVESQVSKLALIFDCFCCEFPKDNNGGVMLEPFFTVLRYLLDKQAEVGNSLLELLIRTTIDFCPTYSAQIYSNLSNSFRLLLSMGPGFVQTLVENRQIDKNLRQVLIEFLPEIYSKRQLTQNDTNPSSSTKINDLENETRQILEMASGVINNEKPEKRKLRPSKSSDHEVEQTKKAIIEEEVEKESKSLDDLVPSLDIQFREGVENFRKAAEGAPNDDSIDPCDEARALFSLIKDANGQIDKEQAKLLATCILGVCSLYLAEKQFYFSVESKTNASEQVNKPIFVIFDFIYKARNQKPTERKSLLNVLKQMAKQNHSIGYLFLYYLSTTTPTKNNRIEAGCYYEFVEYMKTAIKDQLCQDMSNCAIECVDLFGYLLPYVFASFHEAGGCPILIESICVTLDEYQAYDLAAQMYSRGDISLFRKDTFSEIFRSSLKWNSHAQNLFWQFIRADSVSFDWIFDSFCLVRENRHPTIGINIMNMLHIMEVEITTNLTKGLFVRNSEDNLTINCLNLIITDTEIRDQLGQKLSILLKAFLRKEDFYRSNPTKVKNVSPEKRVTSEFSNLQTIFEHLEKILTIRTPKKGSLVQGVVTTEPLLSFYKTFKKNENVFDEMSTNYTNLFQAWKSVADNESGKSSKPAKGRRTNDSPSDSKETRAKKARVTYELLSSDDDD